VLQEHLRSTPKIAEAMRIMKNNSAEFGCDHIESWDNQGNVSSDGGR
jgi:hypothetical protein